MVASVAALSAELLAEMSAHPSKAAYDACIAARAECSSLEADVINYAIFRARAVDRIRAGEFGLHPAIDQHGAEDVRLALAGIVADSKQPLERIAALMLEHYNGSLAGMGQYGRLADRAYEDLQLRPIPEAHLLSERHRSAPAALPAAEEFAALAYGGDPRARRAAFVALGHADTARQLHAAVVGLGPDSEHWFDAAMSVCICGIACADSLLHLTAASAQARAALYEAVGFAPERDRPAMVELLLQHTPSTAEGTEQALRNQFLRDALSERR
jgi:hypothetical protein